MILIKGQEIEPKDIASYSFNIRELTIELIYFDGTIFNIKIDNTDEANEIADLIKYTWNQQVDLVRARN